jgi:hypothetical protein
LVSIIALKRVKGAVKAHQEKFKDKYWIKKDKSIQNMDKSLLFFFCN